MGETEINKTSIDANNKSRNAPRKVFDPALPQFFVQLPNKIQDGLKSRLKIFRKDKGGMNFGSSFLMKGKVSPTDFEANLENQLEAWRQNPTWLDQPAEIKVSVPKGSLCNLRVKVNVGLPPDAIFNIVIDPDNKRVFKNIKEVISRRVLVDEGLRQVVEVEQAAIWKFLWWSGTIAVHVLVDQNRADHSMKFRQVKTGFMKRFEGRWKVEPLFVDEHMCSLKPSSWEEYNCCTGGKGRIGSTVTLDQLIQPALLPPPPISWYLRGITTRTTEMLITDLLAETSRIREDISALKYGGTIKPSQDNDVSDEILGRTDDIKERWRMRRRMSKLQNRRPLVGI